MSLMTQKVKPINSSSDSEQSFINVLDERPVESSTDAPFDDMIGATFARLQDIIATKNSVEIELSDLFTKRRTHTLEELEKARRRLDFVDEEEKRMKNMVKEECFRQSMVIATPFGSSASQDISLVPPVVPPQCPPRPLIMPNDTSFGKSPAQSLAKPILRSTPPIPPEKSLPLNTTGFIDVTENFILEIAGDAAATTSVNKKKKKKSKAGPGDEAVAEAAEAARRQLEAELLAEEEKATAISSKKKKKGTKATHTLREPWSMPISPAQGELRWAGKKEEAAKDGYFPAPSAYGDSQHSRPVSPALRSPVRSPFKSPTQLPPEIPPRSPLRSPVRLAAYLPRSPARSPIRSPARLPNELPRSPARSPIRSPAWLPDELPRSPARSPLRSPARLPDELSSTTHIYGDHIAAATLRSPFRSPARLMHDLPAATQAFGDYIDFGAPKSP